MPARKLFAISLLSVFATIVIACGSGSIPEADSVESLGTALEAAGMRVDGPNENDRLSANYFSIPGMQYTASGETLFVYEFPDDDELATQKALVSPDGWGIGLKYIQWTVGPSYYQNGRLIVIYDGEKSLIMDTLTSAMGDRFAPGNPA